MATIKSLARKLRKLNMEALKRQAVRNKSALFVDIQRQQLRQGMNSKEEFIQPLYPKGYARYKSTLSTYHAPMNVPDLYLTGAWARGIKMIIKGSKYDFLSADNKHTKLIKKYGKKIMGIAQFNMPRIRAGCNLELRRLIGKRLK